MIFVPKDTIRYHSVPKDNHKIHVFQVKTISRNAEPELLDNRLFVVLFRPQSERESYSDVNGYSGLHIQMYNGYIYNLRCSPGRLFIPHNGTLHSTPLNNVVLQHLEHATKSRFPMSWAAR